MKLQTQPYKGSRDFYPIDKRLRDYIFKNWITVAERYGYESYDAPIIEPTELYRAKSGDELVGKEMYSFTDRAGRDVSIRPEMTPSVARMIAARRQEIPFPARWYSIPNLWRYQRPQRGRLREHWQLNLDIFGVKTIDAELELILLVNDIMRSFGANQKMYDIRINSRKLTALIMAEYLELDSVQSHLMIKLLDRMRKLSKDVFESEAAAIFDETNKKQGISRLKKLTSARSMGDLPEGLLSSPPIKQIQLLFTHLKENHVNNAHFDFSLVRGLDYYTDIVFEVFDLHPENNRSMFGGGRYDSLVGMFGVESIPTVGFGMGDVTVLNFIESHGLLPELYSPTDIYVISVGDVLRQSQGIAGILREEGVNVAVDISGRKLEKQIQTAVKNNIPYALFVGDKELSEERFTLKHLPSETSHKMSLARVVSTVSDYRNPSN